MTVELGLGTVQFGLDYGISSAGCRPTEDEVRRILSYALSSGIKVIDTAAVYGESESILGRCLPATGARLITKTRPLRERTCGTDANWIRESFARSLQRLRIESVEGLLVHHAADLLGPSGDVIYRELLRLRDQKLVRKIGLSAYSGPEVDTVLNRYDVDLIQVPINVFDQRLVQGGQLQRLRARGVEIHVRSVFLQGLLLMEPVNLPVGLTPLRPSLHAWRETLNELAITPAQGAFSYVKSLDVDVIVIGVESATQLQNNKNDFAVTPKIIDFKKFSIDNEAVLNPSRWNLSV